MPIIRNEKIARDGWKKQATCDDPRLSEMAEMYERIGFEVHLEPFNAENESAAPLACD